MITLLDALGIKCELGVVRSDGWGPLDDELQSFAQFYDFAVRCGSDPARYYVPYVDGVGPGALPEAWGLSWVLAPEPGLLQKVSQAAAEAMSAPGSDMHAVYREVRERADREGWYVLEQVQAGAN